MKKTILNKRNFGAVVFFFSVMLLSRVSVLAQDGFAYEGFRIIFADNLTELSGAYPWNNNDFFCGAFYQKEKQGRAAVPGYWVFSKEMPEFVAYYSFINGLTVSQKHALIKVFSYYEDDFDRVLANAGLSDDLKYLPAVLSAMNNSFVGNYRRAGLWQLTHFQAVMNGLLDDRMVDERLDVEKATKAAVDEMSKNMQLFNDERLAVLAYVFGKTKIRNLCDDIEGDFTFGDFVKIAPKPVCDFIAKFQAVAVFLAENTFTRNGGEIASGIVYVEKQIHFKQFAGLGLDEDELKFYNPQYRYSIVPEGGGIRLPRDKKSEFLTSGNLVYDACDSAYFEVTAQHVEYPPEPNRQYVGGGKKNLNVDSKIKIDYTLKSGDVLGSIAEKFDVKVADLKTWNNIYDPRRIKAGQKLAVYVDDDKAGNYKKINADMRKKTTTPDFSLSAIADFTSPEMGKKVEHVVKNGESPYTIAKQYEGVAPDDILKWNSISDARKIQIGQKLIIYVK